MLPLFAVVCLLVICLFLLHRKCFSDPSSPSRNEKANTIIRELSSVNYHFTRRCNYKCGFCFHTATNDNQLSLEKAKEGLRLLKEKGLRKLNVAGDPKFLGELCRYCKEDINLESVSIVSNGSLIKEPWMKKYAKYIDILAISCDSFNEDTNVAIGRGTGKHVEKLRAIRQWCYDYEIKFKINSVVNAYNYDEDMRAKITELAPYRWKVFQVLILGGENDGSEGTLRDAGKFVITAEQFKVFTDLHNDCPGFVPESNDLMQNSYIILDEEMRFLDCSTKGKIPSKSILEVGVEEAFKFAGFNQKAFIDRGGEYEWCKSREVSDIEDIGLRQI